MKVKFSEQTCHGELTPIDNNRVTVDMAIHESVPSKKIFYIAAAPPEHRSSFSGSGLPFASPAQAFDNTPNQGYATLDGDNKTTFTILFPNSFYAGLGSLYVKPTLYISYNNGYADKVVNIKLSNGIPYRTNTYDDSRVSPAFYDGIWKLPVRSQEQILKDSAYPSVNIMHDNFWGLKPPV